MKKELFKLLHAELEKDIIEEYITLPSYTRGPDGISSKELDRQNTGIAAYRKLFDIVNYDLNTMFTIMRNDLKFSDGDILKYIVTLLNKE